MSYPQTPAPSGATAMCAGVLAALGSLAHLLSAAGSFIVALIPPRVYCDRQPCPQPAYLPHLAVAGGIGIVLLSVGCLLAAGAFGLFRRRHKGQTRVQEGCVLALVSHLVGLAVVAILISTREITDSDAVDFSITVAIALLFPLVTLALASSPSTKRWLDHTPAR
ncbi:hypothetical protein [Nocardia sp. NPDC051832]|uniref:hypothetical protein n=1 Tax=Nocardia sp. NPDC051832 TaxID=3155673 RepID=UPI00343E705B